MWKLTALIVFSAVTRIAGAHTLPGDVPLARRLEHTLSASHHSADLIFILVVLMLLIAFAKAWSARKRQ